MITAALVVAICALVAALVALVVAGMAVAGVTALDCALGRDTPDDDEDRKGLPT
ncbi:holin [Gordonia phage SallySpecial]|uniref:Holin n=1 Tax=Gordonia phage SallySpecial TaxID=2079570 RepID=A0A2P1CCT8_9CAUD|nr:holin [Gordonia phage SallySpecial]AVJ48755.1 holin [Gordonia phage SallySpecial]